MVVNAMRSGTDRVTGLALPPKVISTTPPAYTERVFLVDDLHYFFDHSKEIVDCARKEGCYGRTEGDN
jgi:hypothetical protein